MILCGYCGKVVNAGLRTGSGVHFHGRCFARGYTPPKRRAVHCAWYAGGPYDGGFAFVNSKNVGRVFPEDDVDETHWYVLIRSKRLYVLKFVGSDAWADGAPPPRRPGMVRDLGCHAAKNCFYEGPRP